MKAIVATKNQGKIEGARRALAHYFEDIEVIGIPAPSNVSEQPLNDEILLGAKNRVKNLKVYCKENSIEADLFLSIESGINNVFGIWLITNIAVIEDNDKFEAYGTSPSFPVPEKYVDDIIKTDLNEVMSNLFNKEKDLHNKKGGIELLTKGKLNRIDLTEHAFIMALTSYLNPNWK